MCVVSMVMDHYRDKWEPYVQQPTVWPVVIGKIPPTITAEEVAEFRRLLERAREYDKRMGQPDCEVDDKRQILKRIAAALGIDISFVDSGESAPTPAAVDPRA